MAAVQTVTADNCICVSPALNCRIILTAPHGGKKSFYPKLFVERKEGKGIKKQADLHTIQILKDIETKVSKLSNGFIKPYTIYLQVHRKYIDANRSVSESAYQTTISNEFGAKVYNVYHNKIQQAINEVEVIHGKGSAILIDIHGQSKMNDHLMIGNKNGKTCGYQRKDDIRNNQNKNIVYKILSYALKDGNLNIHGWNQKQTILNGGYTTQRYSGYLNNQRFERMAIQFEFGRNLRENRGQIVNLLSKGLYDVSVISESLYSHVTDDIKQVEMEHQDLNDNDCDCIDLSPDKNCFWWDFSFNVEGIYFIRIHFKQLGDKDINGKNAWIKHGARYCTVNGKHAEILEFQSGNNRKSKHKNGTYVRLKQSHQEYRLFYIAGIHWCFDDGHGIYTHIKCANNGKLKTGF